MRPLLAGTVAAAALFAASPAGAVAIETFLVNPSFENGTQASGCPISWTCGGSPAPGVGVYQPTAVQYTPGADGLLGALIVPDGSHAAVSPTAVSGSGSIKQSTSTTWAAGTDYSFKFWIGLPNNGVASTTFSVTFLQNGVQGGPGSELPVYSLAAQLPAAGQWKEFTLTVSQAQISNAVAVGKSIGVLFFMGTSNNGQSVNIDIVSPQGGGNDNVPVPGAVWLMGSVLAGAAGIRGWRRRRQI